ncbi:ParA family protein [Streptomyces lydicus]|uniref:ParA family protein n=1 Tax=Streptomyces lydicus TaxID=47763 RepID=UPI001010BAE0|nr:ParA family protein [Streptomyces lydicus]MCZ1012117.1 ParA family protein [Streptomyces lydicus]
MSGKTLRETAAGGPAAQLDGQGIPAQQEDSPESGAGAYVPPEQESDVVAVAGFKGGVGKSRTAKELAWLLGAVLTDFEWDWGGVTRGWGYFEEDRIKSPLIRAFQTGETPKPLSGRGRKPDLIPGHTDFERNQPRADVVAKALLQWTRELKRRLVVDTHPGGSESTYGAMAASRVTVVPAVLGNEELRALEGLLRNLPDYPLLLIPYKVGRSPAAWALDELERLATEHKALIGPFVSNYSWIPNRRTRVPICASPSSKRSEQFVEEMRAVAEAVDSYGR